jgi:hypothetical protein
VTQRIGIDGFYAVIFRSGRNVYCLFRGSRKNGRDEEKEWGEGWEEMRMKEDKRSSSYLFLNLNKIISPSII